MSDRGDIKLTARDTETIVHRVCLWVELCLRYDKANPKLRSVDWSGIKNKNKLRNEHKYTRYKVSRHVACECVRACVRACVRVSIY